MAMISTTTGSNLTQVKPTVFSGVLLARGSRLNAGSTFNISCLRDNKFVGPPSSMASSIGKCGGKYQYEEKKEGGLHPKITLSSGQAAVNRMTGLCALCTVLTCTRHAAPSEH